MRPPTVRRTGALPQEAPELTCAIAASGQLVRPSRAFQQAMGLSGDSLAGRPVLEFIHPGDRAAVEGALAWLANNEGPITFEARWRHADGAYHWLEWTVKGGARDGMRHAWLRDVTRWKQDEALALAHVRVLEAVVQGLPLEEVFGHVAALLEALNLDLFPAIHLLDPAENTLVLVAGAAFPDGLRRALESLPLPDGPGAAVVAARDRQFVVSGDLSLETHWRGRRELPLLHGVRAEWSHPVIDATGALLGTVTVFLPQPAGPRPRDRQILALASQLVATALGRFRSTDTARADAERLRSELAAAERQRTEDAAALETRLAGERAATESRMAGEIAALEAQLAEARASRDEELARVREAEAERGSAHEALEARLRDAEEAARRAEEAALRAADERDEAERRADQLALHKAELESRVVEAEVAQELLQGDLEQLRMDAESRQGRSAELKQQLALAEQQREGLERELESARAAALEREGLAARLAQATAEREQLEQRLGDLATLLAESRTAVAEARAAAEHGGAAQAEIETLQRELRESEASRALLETGHSELRRKALDADAELQTLGLKVAEFDAVRAGLEQALAEWRERFAHADQRRGEAEAMLREGRQALEDVIPLRAQLSESERRRGELEIALHERQPAQPPISAAADVDEDMAALHMRLAASESARRRLEAELASQARTEKSAAPASAALLRTLFEGSAAPMAAVDEHGRVVFWNRTAAQLLGRSEAEVLGRELASVTGEASEEREERVGNGEHAAARQVWRRPDGTAVSLMVSSVPLTTGGGERPGTLIVALPNGEETRVRTLTSLDHLPGLASGIARQVAELLTEIVAGTSPVRAPRGRTAQKPLEAIEYVARRASELVRHLMVTAGEEIVEGESVDLTTFVERMRGELGAMLPPEIELHLRLTPHLPPMVGDPAQLRQVVAQLVTNSAEALEGRRGVISVATGLVDADRQYLARTYFDDGLPEGRYLYLEVSDTGRGMDAETLAHLFEPQFSSKGAGRGLGLALVLGVVRAHHGALQVYSKPDVGTTVRVLLPTAGARGRYSLDEVRAHPSVLIVDEDRALRGTAARMLEHWGFGVVEAGDVREGMELLRERPTVQLVVLEAGLRVDDGPAAERLREVREDVRVLLAGDVNGSGNGGTALGVVSRPFAPVELVAAVRAALGARRERAAGEAEDQPREESGED